MKKNLLKHLLLLIVALGCWSTSSAQEEFQAETFDINGIGYTTTSDSTVCVSSGQHCTGDIVLPIAIEVDGVEYAVTSIGESAFWGNGGLTSIEIPNSVISIGNFAFSECTGLTSIELPNTVTSIGIGAFDGSAIFNNSEYWNNGIFYLGNYIIKVNQEELPSECTIKPGTITISDRAFDSCVGLTSIGLPNSLITIGDYAFSGCSSLASIELPNSVTSIGDGAFEYCQGLTLVNFGNSVTSIGNGAFTKCFGLTSIEIPNSVTSIGGGAFNLCSGLTSVTIGNSVTSIGGGAFSGCSGLTTVNFNAENCTSMSDYANLVFDKCSSLKTVNIGEKVTNIPACAFYDCSGLTSIKIPNSVTSIGSWAFFYCKGLTSVTIGNSCTSIGYEAFYCCDALASVNIPESVVEIGGNAFANCPLESIELPKVEWLYTANIDLSNSNLFNENTLFDGRKVRSFEVPDNVTEMPNLPLLYPILESLSVGNGMKTIPAEMDGAYVNIRYLAVGENITKINAKFPNLTTVISYAATPPTITQETFPNCTFEGEGAVILATAAMQDAYAEAKYWEDMQLSNMSNVAEVTVDVPGELSFEIITDCNLAPAKVTGLKVIGEINAEDFDQMRINMKSLINLDLSEAVIDEIPANSFAGKFTLKSVKLPKNCTTIGESAFEGCRSITELTLPTALTTVGDRAFSGCSNVEDLTLPTDLKSIGAYAFEGLGNTQLDFNYALESIGDYAFSNSNLEMITFQNRLKSIGASAFEGCRLQQELILPDNIEKIGARAFYGQTGIVKHLTIPETVKELGAEAFAGTSIVTTFIPGKLTELMYSLFADCKLLDAVYIPDNITAIGESVFMNCKTLTNVRMSQNLQSVAAYAFNSTNIRSVIVPDLMTIIDAYTFGDCLNLRSVSLPAATLSLQEGAFSGCRNLLNLTVKAVTPPTVASTAFKGVNTDKCIISIPTDSYKQYVLADYWGRFIQMRNDIAVETEGSGTITFDNGEEGEVETDSVATDEPMQSKKRLPKRRSPDTITTVEDGSTIYIPQDGLVHFYITPDEGEKIEWATFNGKDILPEIKEGVFSVVSSEKNGKLEVRFSSTSKVDNVKADRTITDNVYYDLMGRRVENPTPGIYIYNGKKVVVKQ